VDLRGWAWADAGPFRFSSLTGPHPGLRALTDAELVARARALRSMLEKDLEAGTVPETERPRARALVARVAGL